MITFTLRIRVPERQLGQGTVGGTRTVTACTPRNGQAGWKLAVAVSDERTVTYLLTRTGHSDYVTPAAHAATRG